MTLSLGIVTGSLSPLAGGLFQSVRLPAIELAKRGMLIDVYGLEDAQFADHAHEWSNLTLHAYPTVGPPRLGHSFRLRRAILDAEHDILHQHGIWFAPSSYTNSWRSRNNKPTVIAPRGMLDPWAVKNSKRIKTFLGLLYENRNLRHTSVLHALNLPEARAFRDFGLDAPIAIIPNAINMPAPEVFPTKPDWMLGDDRKVLLFLARIHPKKGLAELISGWQQLIMRRPDLRGRWRIVAAGWDDGGHLDVLKAQARHAGLEADVHFPGGLHGASKSQALAHAEAFILPSYSEGLPMSVLEAWSWKLPAFITRECNLPEAFAADAAIEISTEPQQLSRALEDFLDDEAGLLRIAENAFDLVQRRYTWRSVTDDMVAMYEWLRGNGGQPDFVISRGEPVH